MAVNVTQNNTTVEVSGSQSTIEVNPTTSDIVVSGTGNTSVTIATAGAKGSTGEKGSSGSAGTSGTSGVDGVIGSSGSAGTSGTSGQDGTLFGSSGTSGLSGTNGTAGSSGSSGTNGTAGSGGTSGTNGTAGSSGTSGITQNLTSLNDFTSSIQTEVDGLSAVTSSLTTTGSNHFYGDQIIEGSDFVELEIGEQYGGGTVFYVSNNLTLIADTSDLSSGITLGDVGVDDVSGGEGLGDGVDNTNYIAINYPFSSTPSKLAYDSTNGGYSDWYLPNGLELNTFISNIGGITGDYATSEQDTVINGGSPYNYFVIINGATGTKVTYASGVENQFKSVKVRAIRKINTNLRTANNNNSNVQITGSLSVSGSLTVNGGVTLSGNLSLNDNEKITFGDSNDLEIYHSGNHSYIRDVGVGSLIVNSDFFRIKNKQDTENMALFDDNGAVTLYYDNVKKFETTADGIAVTGSVDISGSLSLNDNEEITLGDSNDLRLYHNGTQNYIDGTATTIIRGNWLYLRKSGTTENFLVGKADGTVELYHNNDKKFETTADGIAITGSVDVSGSLTLPDGTTSYNYVGLGDTDDLKILHNGTNSIITETNLASSLFIRSYNNVTLGDAGGSETMLKAISHGAVELYHNNDKKFETTADGISMTGRITNLSEPTASQDAATKAYVDANSGGGGGSSLQSRTSISGSTTSIADTAEADLDITGFKSYMLQKVETSVASRVRLYTDSASRTADASRAEGTDPTSDSGLIAEVITTGSQAILISPGAFGFNDESTPTTTIPCRVTNKSGGASTVEVTLQVLQLEA